MNSPSTVRNAVESLMTSSMPIGDRYDTTTIGGNTNWCSTCNCFWTGHHVCFYPWYPIHWAPPQKDKMQTVFKLIKHLLAKDMVRLNTIDDFIQLVDEIVTMI